MTIAEDRYGDGPGPDSPVRVSVRIGSWDSKPAQGILVPPGPHPDETTACLHTMVSIPGMGSVSLDLDFEALRDWVEQTVQERQAVYGPSSPDALDEYTAAETVA